MANNYRNLTDAEVTRLEALGNRADDWSVVLVSPTFDAECLRGNSFDGPVRLGAIARDTAATGGRALREGIYNSTLTDVTLGDHPTVHNVCMLAGYTLGNNVTLLNIDEMTADADAEVWLEPMNENGGRRLMPFSGMTIGDAYLWARYRGHKQLMQRLEEFTRKTLANGAYGTVGDYCTIKNTKVIRNVAIRSTEGDRTLVDSCMVLSDGVVGSGCTLEYGVVAVRFLLGEHVHLEFGLRLNDTVVGDNSTLARCEVGNSIIFPAHEQHHNNSFLIAGLVMGQSNIAAGGTIGSNHNSRTADGEIAAGRGFWPGLCCSFKHSSRFASYCLLAKADYPAELDITRPMARVNNNASSDCLEVMPAYWWMYNMYAMDRNSKKFAKRDKRTVKAQHIEFDNLAPDTAEELLHGIELLDGWISASSDGRVYGEGMEKSKRRTVILKAEAGREAYREMLTFYAMKSLVAAYGEALPPAELGSGERMAEWVNLGGQLVAASDMERLIADTESGAIDSWQALNARLDSLWQEYPRQRAAHAYKVLCHMAGTDTIDDAVWSRCLQKYKEIEAKIAAEIKTSRHKDEVNPFRRMTYWNEAEMEAVLG